MGEQFQSLVRPRRSGRARAVEPDPLKGGDIYRWAIEQAELLRAGRFDEVDIINVADEIEDVGRSDLRALRSTVEIVLIHMLKWEQQPSRRSRSWSNSIFSHRLKITRLIKESPSLSTKRDDIIDEAYRDARLLASRATNLSLSQFPEACPYSWSDIMETPYEILDRQD